MAQPDTATGAPGQGPDTLHEAIAALERALEAERTARAQERERASQAEQAAAMWQERARGLQVQLALPPAVQVAPWWAFWRRGGE